MRIRFTHHAALLVASAALLATTSAVAQPAAAPRAPAAAKTPTGPSAAPPLEPAKSPSATTTAAAPVAPAAPPAAAPRPAAAAVAAPTAAPTAPTPAAEPAPATAVDPPAKWALSVEGLAGLRVVVDNKTNQASASFDVGRPAALPRLAFDVMLLKRFTLGGAVGIGYRTQKNNQGLSDGTAFSVLLAPRVGYVLPLTKSIGLWPKLGVAFARTWLFPTNVDNGNQTGLDLTIDVPATFRFAPHFFFTAGPFANIGLLRSAKLNGFVRNAADIPKEREFGISVGLFRNFD